MTPTWKSLLSRLRSLRSSPKPRQSIGRWRRASALAVERLEDRTVPALTGTFQMHVSTLSGFNLNITDGDGNDTNPDAGAITFSGNAGNFALTVDTGLSKPVLGTASSPHMALSFVAIKSVDSGADTLTIDIGDQGFVTSPLTMDTQVGGTFSGSFNTVDAKAFYDNNNTLYGTGGGSSYHQTFTTTPFTGTGTLAVTGATPYSLTQRIVITAGAGSGVTSGIFEILSPPIVQIGDFVWNDTNASGCQDSGELGIPGVTLTLTGTNSSGNPVTDHKTTDANGAYLFTEVPGTYTATIDTSNFASGGALFGFTASPSLVPGCGTASDSNGSPSGTTPGTLPSGSSDTTVDFGFYKPVQIGDFVWNDLNANGIQDGGEPGINGVILTLTGTTGSGASVTLTQTTSGNGGYLFSGLTPGTYTVTADSSNFSGSGALVGYFASPTGLGGNAALDSNPSPTGTTPSALPGGSSDLTLDFGYYKLASLGDFVWNDLNANGIQDSGEPGIAGAVVTLAGPSGPQTYTTLANGYYQFTGLIPGSYTVSVTPLAGFVASPSLQGGNPALDSNGSPTSTTLASGGSDQTLDFGYYSVGSISGNKLLAVPTPGESSRMTGGGSVFTVAGDYALAPNGTALPTDTRVTHGFEIHCDPLNVPNNIEINWGGGQNFHMTSLDQIICLDDPTISPYPPNAMSDTFIGRGTGKFNGVDGATLWFTFTDAGEPGNKDTAAYLIKDSGGNTVLSVGHQPAAIAHATAAPFIQFGNQQAHKEHAASFSGGTTYQPWTIPGVTILLLNATQTSLITSTSLDGTGHFQFTGLTPGSTYVVAEEFPAGYQQVSPTSGTTILYSSPVHAGDVIGPLGFTITVLSGQDTVISAPFINEAQTSADSRWTGGGSVFTATGDYALSTTGTALPANTRVTHGFELHCDLSPPNNLEINWGGGQNFHLTSLTNAVCLDDPSISPTPPSAPSDTIIAAGVGRFNNVDGYNIQFTFTDAGEPGRDDKATYLIWKDMAGGAPGVFDSGIDSLVLQVGAKTLTFGNHQAHRDSGGGVTTAAVSAGQFASISFWSNSNGQATIKAFDAGSTDTKLGNWLASNFPNLFGDAAGPLGNLAGKTNAAVAQLYKNLNINGVANNTYVQAAAVALGIYADTTSLGGAEIVANGLAKKFGFVVSTSGGAGATISDGASGPAYGTLSSTAVSTWQALGVVNANYDPKKKLLFGGDSVGLDMANNVLSQINAVGHIALVTSDSGTTASDQALITALHPLETGSLVVAIDELPAGDPAAAQARIDDVIAGLNGSLGVFGVSLVGIAGDESVPADIHLHFASTSVIGGVADGVLGVTEAGGRITVITGWNYYYGSNSATVGADQYDFETVVAHELGHALGLGHSQDGGSVMFSSLGMAEGRRTLTSFDINAVREVEDGSPEPLMATPFRGSPPSIISPTSAIPQLGTAGTVASPVIVISVPVPVAANTATVVAPTAAFQMLFAPIGASFLGGSEGTNGFAYASTANSNVGDDTLIGGEGSDLHIGAVGSEILIGGFGSDIQSENASTEALIDGYFTLDAIGVDANA